MTASPVIVELLAIAAMLGGGAILLRTAGLRGWGLAPLGFLAGVFLYLAIGTVQVIAFLPTTPVLTVALTVAGPAGWWFVRWRRGDDVGLRVLPSLLTAAVVAGLVVGLRAAHLVKFHTDSVYYLMSGWLIADGSYRGGASLELITKRFLGVPLLHAPANIGGPDLYLRSVTPLLALAVLGTLGWMVQRGGRDLIEPRRLALFGGLGVFVLITNNRFVFSAFYLNGHLLAGAELLVIAGAGWLLAIEQRGSAWLPHARRGGSSSEPASAAAVGDAAAGGIVRHRAVRGPVNGDRTVLRLVQLVAVPALIVTRPEGFLIAALALLPTLLGTGGGPERAGAGEPAGAAGQTHRRTAAAVFGVSCLAWHAFLAVISVTRGADITSQAWGGVAAGVAVLVLIPFLGRDPILGWASRLLWTAEALVWLGAAAFAASRPEVLSESVRATYINLIHGQGLWGYSLVVLGLLVVGALIVFPFRHQVHLRFPLTTFVPLAILLAYLREGAYRVGSADSLVRMFMQYVPLAVLMIIAAFATSPRAVPARPPSTPLPQGRSPYSAESANTATGLASGA